MKRIHRYHAIYWTLLGLSMGGIGLVNGLVDPLGLFKWVTRPGFNAVKPLEADHRRLIKAHAIRQRAPHGLVLGSSRAEAGIDPGHPAWPAEARPVYNAAFPDANVYEMRRYFEHALAVSDLRCAVIGLDFFAFNAHFANRPDFSEQRLAVDAQGDRRAPPIEELLSLLFSGDALRMSWTTLRNQDRAPYLKPDGQQAPRNEAPRAFHGYRGLFLLSEQEYIRYKWRPPPARRFELKAAGAGQPLMEFYRILELARRRGVSLRLFLSPDHARLAEGVAQSGLWPMYEQWRRELVELIEIEAARANAPPVELWDFNTYSAAMCEPVPAWDDLAASTRWFNDASHYSTNFGHVILDTVWRGVTHSDAEATRLTADRLPSHLALMRAGRARYAEHHPDEVREIVEIVRASPDSEVSARLNQLYQRR